MASVIQNLFMLLQLKNTLYNCEWFDIMKIIHIQPWLLNTIKGINIKVLLQFVRKPKCPQVAVCCVWMFLFSCSAVFSHCVSSTEVNSWVFCCQARDLEVLSALGHIFSHDETALEGAAEGSRVAACVHPPNPLQSISWPLSYPVNVVFCHCITWRDTRHLHFLSRFLHLGGRLFVFDFTPNSCKKRHCNQHTSQVR